MLRLPQKGAGHKEQWSSYQLVIVTPAIQMRALRWLRQGIQPMQLLLPRALIQELSENGADLIIFLRG